MMFGEGENGNDSEHDTGASSKGPFTPDEIERKNENFL